MRRTSFARVVLASLAGLVAGGSSTLASTLALPSDAVPMDVDRSSGRILFISSEAGLVEAEERDGGLVVCRKPLSGKQIPAGAIVDARYGPRGEIQALIRARGLLRVRGEEILEIPLESKSGGLLRVLPLRSGDTWVAHAPRFAGGARGGFVEIVRDNKSVDLIPVPDANVATIADWLELPDGRVWAATRAGVVEIQPGGQLKRLTRGSTAALAQNRRTGVVLTVGSAVLLSSDDGFRPLVFSLGNTPPTGNPIDVVALDEHWALLYPAGLAIVIRTDGQLVQAWDDLPSQSRRLVASPTDTSLLLGGGPSGVVSLEALH